MFHRIGGLGLLRVGIPTRLLAKLVERGDTVHFRNPSGHTEEARIASLPVAGFEFFGGRGVSLT